MEMAAILLVIVVAFGAGCFACRAVHKRVPTRRATDLMSVSDELQTIKRLVASVVNIADLTAHEHQQHALRLSFEAVERTRLRHRALERGSQQKSHLEIAQPADREVA